LVQKVEGKNLEVVGIDISKKRLKYAKVKGNNDLVICASCTHLPFKSNCFDSVLLIEVIEHLHEEGQEATLREIRRVLNSEGTIIITTPNRPIYHLLAKYLHLFKYNPEHVKELSLQEVRNLVMKYFKILSIDGKISSKRFLGFLDKILPKSLCWDILIICRKEEQKRK
jgi:ubiquinone/menaquinone biosynthesis C-methylase UbiE